MPFEDTRVHGDDGLVHLLPPAGKLTFCGRLPGRELDDHGDQPPPHEQCVELAAARDAASVRRR